MDILYGYKCISKMDISFEYTWICKVEHGYEWISLWITSWIMQRYDGWISMNMINGYLIRLRLDINGYLGIQQITSWKCKWLVHGYTVWI